MSDDLNGFRADFSASFFSGVTGVREKDGVLRIGFFARAKAIQTPAKATLDGRPIRVTEARSEAANMEGQTKLRAFTLTAQYVEEI